MTPADKCLFSLIMDLVTVMIPDPATHHTERSQAAQRLLDARRGGWEGFDALVLDALVRRATAPPEAVWTPRGVVGAAETEKPPTGFLGGLPPAPPIDERRLQDAIDRGELPPLPNRPRRKIPERY